jgi:hypothetical protein
MMLQEYFIEPSTSEYVLSTTEDKPKGNFVIVTLKMPNGEEHTIPLPPKKFSSGRLGYYSQIPSFIYNDEVYGGQIQVWKKGKDIESEK